MNGLSQLAHGSKFNLTLLRSIQPKNVPSAQLLFRTVWFETKAETKFETYFEYFESEKIKSLVILLALSFLSVFSSVGEWNVDNSRND